MKKIIKKSTRRVTPRLNPNRNTANIDKEERMLSISSQIKTGDKLSISPQHNLATDNMNTETFVLPADKNYETFVSIEDKVSINVDDVE